MLSETELPVTLSPMFVWFLHGLISLPRVKQVFYDSFHAKQTESEAFISLHVLDLNDKFWILHICFL